MSRYDHKIETSLEGIENLSKEKKEKERRKMKEKMEKETDVRLILESLKEQVSRYHKCFVFIQRHISLIISLVAAGHVWKKIADPWARLSGRFLVHFLVSLRFLPARNPMKSCDKRHVTLKPMIGIQHLFLDHFSGTTLEVNAGFLVLNVSFLLLRNVYFLIV